MIILPVIVLFFENFNVSLIILWIFPIFAHHFDTKYSFGSKSILSCNGSFYFDKFSNYYIGYSSYYYTSVKHELKK